MRRRNIFKLLLALPFGLVLPAKGDAPAIKRQPRLLQKSAIAGVQYYQADAVWSNLKQGDLVLLKTEPDNRYDADAVEVYWHGAQSVGITKLGYLPRKQNYAISQLLRDNQQVYARITQLTESDDPWQRIQVSVFL